MLSAETLVQCGIRSFNLLYFVEVMLLTKVYYTHAYNSEIKFYNGPNLRTQWYVRHRNFIRSAQKVYTIIAITYTILFFYPLLLILLLLLIISSLLLIAIFPLLASMYYGILFLPVRKFNLRSYGRLKPFIIGFVATGTVTVYPLIFFSTIKSNHFISMHQKFITSWQTLCLLQSLLLCLI